MSLESLTITAVGDISLSGLYRRSRFVGKIPWNSLESDWADSDLRIGNLEAQITDGPRVSDSKFVLRAGSTAARILKGSTFDLLNMANNHAMDFGVKGLEDTMSLLDELAIPYVGCGLNLEQANTPRILKKGKYKIGFLSFCDVLQVSHLYAEVEKPGVAPLNESSFEAVRNLRQSVDWLIVQLHWGTEMSCLPSTNQRAIAKRFVTAGADAIIGHHPHVVQPMEVIDDVPIWYSLGNFSFTNELWQGVKKNGESFVGEYKLHPLARQSIVARMILEKGNPPAIDVQHVLIKKDGSVVLDNNVEDRDLTWRKQCKALTSSKYGELSQLEEDKSGDRRKWQTQPGSLMNRVRLKAFQFGLIRPV